MSAEAPSLGPRARGTATVLLVVVSTAGFCLWSRSWESLPKAIYDLASAPFVLYLGAKTILELWFGPRDRLLAARGMLLVPMAVIPQGAEFLKWPLSGHLTDVLIAAGMVALHPSRSRGEIAWATAVVPVVVYLRWMVMDEDAHLRTVNAVWVAALLCGAALLAGRLIRAGKAES